VDAVLVLDVPRPVVSVAVRSDWLDVEPIAVFVGSVDVERGDRDAVLNVDLSRRAIL